MRKMIMILFVLSVVALAVVPAHAEDYPPVCIPQPQLSFTQSGNSTALHYNPGMSVACALTDFNTPHLEHQVEMAWVQYRVEHQERIGQTDNWTTTTIAGPFLVAADQISGTAGPFHNVSGSVDITGATFATQHRYRLVVSVGGTYSLGPTPPFTSDMSFMGEFFGAWVNGPLVFEVAQPFVNRPTDLAAPTRPDVAPVVGFQSR